MVARGGYWLMQSYREVNLDEQRRIDNQDLNLRPVDYHSSAQPTQLSIPMIGMSQIANYLCLVGVLIRGQIHFKFILSWFSIILIHF